MVGVANTEIATVQRIAATQEMHTGGIGKAKPGVGDSDRRDLAARNGRRRTSAAKFKVDRVAGGRVLDDDGRARRSARQDQLGRSARSNRPVGPVDGRQILLFCKPYHSCHSLTSALSRELALTLSIPPYFILASRLLGKGVDTQPR